MSTWKYKTNREDKILHLHLKEHDIKEATRKQQFVENEMIPRTYFWQEN